MELHAMPRAPNEKATDADFTKEKRSGSKARWMAGGLSICRLSNVDQAMAIYNLALPALAYVAS
jgi:hypothetical protein